MYSKIVLQKDRESSWIFGHPWIFSKAIKQAPDLEPGSLISLFSSDDQFLGTGYYNKKQTIAIRMLSKKSVEINTSWFSSQLLKLKNYRLHYLNKHETSAYRLCFGESDGIAGLVIDVYENTAVVQINTKGIERLLPQILEALPSVGIEKWIVDTDTISAKKEGVSKILNPEMGPILAKENALQIIVPIQKGQKTGWFCDQRDNRFSLKQFVADHKITSLLNLFSYTGGFSLFALLGGCPLVVNVDQDEYALKLFEEMVQKNGLPKNYEVKHEDVWQFLQNCNSTFDLVIVDPPAFVKEESKKMQGLKGYLDLFKKSIAKLSKGGFLMVYSCSHFVTNEDLAWVLRQAYAQTQRFFQTVTPLHQSFDHPVPAWFLEASYLKGFLLQEII